MAPLPSPSAIELGDPQIVALGAGQAVVIDGLLGIEAAQGCRDALEQLHLTGQLKPAGVGRSRQRVPEIRGDAIAWLGEDGLPPPLAMLWATLAALRDALNQAAWLGLGELEVQVARYDSQGLGYARHLDAFRGGRSRKVTAIYYLNEGWRPEDGGALRAFLPDGAVEDVAPVADRLLLFLSDRLPHEVTPCFATRWAVTAWMRARAAVPLGVGEVERARFFAGPPLSPSAPAPRPGSGAG